VACNIGWRELADRSVSNAGRAHRLAIGWRTAPRRWRLPECVGEPDANGLQCHVRSLVRCWVVVVDDALRGPAS
jgi:hypothetical protein